MAIIVTVAVVVVVAVLIDLMVVVVVVVLFWFPDPSVLPNQNLLSLPLSTLLPHTIQQPCR